MNIRSIIQSRIRFFFSKTLSLRGSKTFLSLFSFHKNNEIRILDSNFIFSKIVIKGHNNIIRVTGSSMRKGSVFVTGDNNCLIVKNGTDLGSMYIAIKGNNCKICIGERCNFHDGYMMAGGERNKIEIGDDCLFAHNINIMGSDSHQILQKGFVINPPRDIVISKHVWVCANSSILKGTIIGENAIVGLGSVVSKEIASNTMNVGNPCKTIKEDIQWNIENSK